MSYSLGCPWPKRGCSAAFVGSCNAAWTLCHQILQTVLPPSFTGLLLRGELQAQEHLISLLPDNANLNLLSFLHLLLQTTLDSSLFSHIKNSVSLRDRARLKTISVSLAGLWLQAIPNPVFGLTYPHKNSFSVSISGLTWVCFLHAIFVSLAGDTQPCF